MKKDNYKKGKSGEDIARKFLEQKGYVYVDANHLNWAGEIDLIMSKDDKLIFVEVKLKTDDRYGKPEEMIDTRKIHRVQKAAEVYIWLNKDAAGKFEKFQIEAVCIETDLNLMVKRISHYERLD